MVNEFIGFTVLTFIDKPCGASVYAFAVGRHREQIGFVTFLKACSQEVCLPVLIPQSCTVIPY
jgi:hypothetical protein